MCWSGRRPDLGCGAEWTPCASDGGVQIVDVERNGRHVVECAASRLLMWGGMDAMCWSGRRPELGCEAEWTPCACMCGVCAASVQRLCGVQIWDIVRIGRQEKTEVASRFRV